MGKLFREPLVHFLVLGGLIFAAWSVMSTEQVDDELVFVSRGQQENLVNTFSRTWQRPPTPAEFRGLLQDFIRQEIAYRESLSMGLDERDIVIRRRLRQKLEMMAQDLVAVAGPTEQELQTWLDSNPERYRLEPSFSFRHIYFSTDRRGSQAASDAVNLLEKLNGGQASEDQKSWGDTIALPASMDNARYGEVVSIFGQQFAEALASMKSGVWNGPVQSGFGQHLVLVESRTESRAASLDEVRKSVERDLISERRVQAVDAMYSSMLDRYKVEIEPLVETTPQQAE